MASKQEILELIVGLKDVIKDIKKVVKDPKNPANDLAVLGDLYQQKDELIAAASGLGNIKVSELSTADVVEIIQALASAGAEIAAS